MIDPFTAARRSWRIGDPFSTHYDHAYRLWIKILGPRRWARREDDKTSETDKTLNPRSNVLRPRTDQG